MRSWSLWAFLPICFSLCTAIGLILVYFIARQYDTITSLGWQSSNNRRSPPYISIAGNQPPASCVFSQVMNMAAFMGFLIGFLRYLQLKPKVRKPWLNIASLITFSLASFGMTLVGNFQWSNDEDVHNAGTSLTFGLGTVFCWLQSIATLRLNLRNEGRRLGIIRFVLSAAITLSMLLYFSLMLRGHHLHGARTQWCLVMFLLAFIGTLSVEFRHFNFDVVCMEHQEPPVTLSDRFSVVSENHPGTTMQTQDHPGYF
ncbi:transmembrane protein 150C [Gadus macrocephalus]|uniref:transmembrane protein 150C n=1 Tax=Gadus macrocephalus TaxID=80720 RepID=UPI0028CB9DCB|nr:transmembrane protein 150C [Gadus macrocephalus]XP_059894534.1 transmembrane protein 150C [Gadus macrocephalus]XP_059894535.1 transmembrane protein 150C [Gadus macrocephalus]